MSWLEPLRLAIKLYNDGDNQACVVQVNNILTDTLPLYSRIRCRILLAHSLESWYEAEAEHFQAENDFGHWRLFQRSTDSARTERISRELRGLLDDLGEELKSWRPDDWYEHQYFWTEADAQDRDAAITKALEEWSGEQADGEEEEAGEQTEGEEESTAEEAEDEDEKAG